MRKSVVFALVLATMFLLGTSDAGAGNGPVFFSFCGCEPGCFEGFPAASFGGVIVNEGDYEIEVEDAEVGFLSTDEPLNPVDSDYTIPEYSEKLFISEIVYPLPPGTLNIACSDQYVDELGNVGTISLLTGTCDIPTCDIQVPVDIRPQSCPNPLNPMAKGVLPVAILGTEDFDVSQIDPASVRLAGVAPLRWSRQDVATPFNGPFVEDCYDCSDWDGDGFLDLSLKFNNQEVIAALGVVDSSCIEISLIGNLMEEYGGTPIEGFDMMLVTPNVDGD